jgi:hypothetical protein
MLSVVVSSVRATAAFDPGDDQPLFVPSEVNREAILADTDLPVRAVLEWLTVLRWVTSGGS